VEFLGIGQETFNLAAPRMTPKHPPGPPMTLGNMRRQGVRHLIGYCLNAACRHQALIDVSGYPDDVEIPLWRAKCSKRGGKCVDVRPKFRAGADEPDYALKK
jgi:hypothetical protein